METKDIKKVILAYSGGLDTFIIIPWLKESYNNCEVAVASADVGQETELDGFEEKAIKTGTSKLYILDPKDEFVKDYTYPCLKANAIYEDVYLLGTAFVRPLIGQKLVEIAKQEGADTICHDCTGKGNDRVRFEPAIKAFTPDMPIIAPWRTQELKPKDDETDYAEACNIPLEISGEVNYSKDKNPRHLSHEGSDLEDPVNEPQHDDILGMRVTPEQALNTPTYITLAFERGIPAALNDEKLGGQAMVTKLSEIGGASGIGVIDTVEGRLVGVKSCGVYETPGGIILYEAHRWLESACLDKGTMHYEQRVGIKLGEILHNGQWFISSRRALNAFVDKTSEAMGDEMKTKLYKEDLTPASISSPYTSYSEQITGSGEDNPYDRNGSAGFINLYGLPVKIKVIMDEKGKK